MSVALYNRSCYSLLESTITIDSLVKYALENNFSAVGLCDRGNFYAANQFFNQCKINKIKPIIGLESSFTYQNNTFPVLLYPKNNAGFITLLHQSFDCSLFEYQQLYEFNEDILIVFPYQSLFFYLLSKDNFSETEQLLANFKDNFYLGIPAANKLPAKQYKQKIGYYIQKYHLNQIPLDLCLYQNENYFDSYKALKVISQSAYFDDNKIKCLSQAHLKSSDELSSLFDADLLHQSDLFAKQIDLQLDKLKSSLPVYASNIASVNNKQYLKDLSLAGLKKRLNNQISEKYLTRLNYELDIITKMGFTDYFLIIYDLMLYCKNNDILVGPGRGSAVGSLVCYCLGITHIDPIEYDLYFERFLNPERISLPDIDLDFPDNKRNQIINYLTEKYGNDKVASIITFNSFQNKSALKETSRILKGTNSSMELMLKIVQDHNNLSLTELYAVNKSFNTLVNSSKNNQLLFKIASQIENLPRHISLHASGIVISAKNLLDVVPLIRYNENLTVGYTYNQLEALGLIKFDILSLRNLTIISNIISDLKLDTPLYQIDKNDLKTYQLLTKGYTLSIFQLESKGMVNLLNKVKPVNLNDLAVLIALYRPGPLNNINTFISNRNSNQITYLHPDLEKILSNTSGVIVFQEQIMEIAVKFAGYSLAKADILRKAIAKKDNELMISNRNQFVSGCINNGYSADLANQLFDLIEKFGLYGFNKAHSYGYGYFAYLMAYLKTHYTDVFYCKCLDEHLGDSNKTLQLINESKLLNRHFNKVDINISLDKYTLYQKKIYLPFSYLKGLSTNTINKLLSERYKNGIFKDFFDFYFRMCQHNISISEVQLLIDAGAFEPFKVNCTTLKNNLFALDSYYQAISGNEKLKHIVSPPVLINYQDDKKQLRKQLYEIYGFYFDDDPFNQYRKLYPNCVNSDASIKVNQAVEMILTVNSITVKTDKNNVTYAVVKAGDTFSSIELVLYGNTYLKYQNQLKKDIIVHVYITKNVKGNFFVNKMEVLED